MHSFADLITNLGGPAAVAKATDAEPGAVRQWKARGSIPPAYWPAIIKLADEKSVRGVTVASLAALAIELDRQRVA